MSGTGSDVTTTGDASMTSVTSERDAKVEGHMSVFVLVLVLKLSVWLANLVVNTAGIVVLATGRQLEKPMGVFILYLTLHNLLIGLVSLPISITTGSMGYWPLGDVFCACSAFLQGYLLRASLAGHTLICLDRYIAIRHPYWYSGHATPRKAGAVCIGLSGVITALMAVLLGLTADTTYYPKLQACFAGVSLLPALTRISAAAFYILCYACVVLTTMPLALTARRHQNLVVPTRGSQEEEPPQDERRRLVAAHLRSFHVVYVMTLTFLLTSVPLTLMVAFLERIPEGGLVFCVWLLYSDSVVSTLIYQTRTRAFRHDLRVLLTRWCCNRYSNNNMAANASSSF